MDQPVVEEIAESSLPHCIKRIGEKLGIGTGRVNQSRKEIEEMIEAEKTKSPQQSDHIQLFGGLFLRFWINGKLELKEAFERAQESTLNPRRFATEDGD